MCDNQYTRYHRLLRLVLSFGTRYYMVSERRKRTNQIYNSQIIRDENIVTSTFSLIFEFLCHLVAEPRR